MTDKVLHKLIAQSHDRLSSLLILWQTSLVHIRQHSLMTDCSVTSGPHDRTRLEGLARTSWQVKSRWKSLVFMPRQDWIDELGLHDERVRSSWKGKTSKMNLDFRTSQVKTKSQVLMIGKDWIDDSRLQVKSRWKSQVLMTGQNWLGESSLHDKPRLDGGVRS